MKIKLLTENAILPTRGSEQAAGLDLYSTESILVGSLQREIISTGISIKVPKGFYGRIAPRSGLAAKYGIDVMAGVVDSDYRGEIKVILFNSSLEAFKIQRGDRIAQLILEQILIVEPEEVESLDETIRGADGFGSTGK